MRSFEQSLIERDFWGSRKAGEHIGRISPADAAALTRRALEFYSDHGVLKDSNIRMLIADLVQYGDKAGARASVPLIGDIHLRGAVEEALNDGTDICAAPDSPSFGSGRGDALGAPLGLGAGAFKEAAALARANDKPSARAAHLCRVSIAMPLGGLSAVVCGEAVRAYLIDDDSELMNYATACGCCAQIFVRLCKLRYRAGDASGAR